MVTKQKKQKTAHGQDAGQDHPEPREDDQETNVSTRLVNDSHNYCLTFYIITFRVLLNWVASV